MDIIVNGGRSAGWLWDVGKTAGGVVLGALISYVATRGAEKRNIASTVAAEERAARARRYAAVHGSIFKLAQIANWLKGLQSHLNECLSNEQTAGLQPWQRLPPFAGSGPPPIYFSTDELTAAHALDHPAIVNRMLLVDAHFNSLISTLTTYSMRRQWLTDQIPAVIDEGDMGHFQLTDDDAKKFAAPMHDLNSLVEGLRDLTAKDLPVAVETLHDLGNVAATYFDDARLAQFEPSKEDETTATAGIPGSPKPGGAK